MATKRGVRFITKGRGRNRRVIPIGDRRKMPERRIYYIKWKPRGFANEKEIIAISGKANADALRDALSEYEQNNLSRNTTKMVTKKEATTSMMQQDMENGDAIIGELNKDPTAYDDSPAAYQARKLRKYYRSPKTEERKK